MMKIKTALSFLFVTMLATTAAMAGSTDGPRQAQGEVISPNERDQFQFVFSGLRPARVWVNGAGRSDLDCFLLDVDGNVVDQDTDDTDTCLLEVVPTKTNLFYVRVVNVGAYLNVYNLITN